MYILKDIPYKMIYWQIFGEFAYGKLIRKYYNWQFCAKCH